jgi:pimeloyl-ACP methyl ester carboxylesterase
LWDRLGAVGMPVALVVGERDEKFGAIAAEMAAALPDAQVVVVPGAGHAVHLEAPGAVAATIDCG